MTGTTRDRLFLAALVVAAAVPRVAGALLRRPWHDEYFTAWLASLSPGQTLAALRLDSGPPLPYLLPFLGAGMGLPPLAVARWVAVLAGIGAVVLVSRVARRSWGDRAGWWAGALLAVHPLAVAWSCEGRAYSLLVLAVAWAWERLERLARDGRGAWGLAAAVSLAAWSHGLGMALAPVLAIAAWTLPVASRRRALFGVAGGLFTSLPWVGVVTSQPVAAITWMVRSFAAIPWPARSVATIRFLSPAADLGEVGDLPSVHWQLEAPTAALVVLLLVLAAARIRPALRQWVGFLLPAAGLAALAFLGMPAFYPGRGEALYLVPALLLVAAAAASRPWSVVAGCLVLLASAFTTAASVRLWATTPPRGEEVMATRLLAALPSGGTVVIGGYWRLGLWYHLGGSRSLFELVSVPAEAASHPGWYDEATLLSVNHEVLVLRQELARKEGRAAVVVSPGLRTEHALLWLARSVGLEPVLRVPGGMLLTPPAQVPTTERKPVVRPDAGELEPAR